MVVDISSTVTKIMYLVFITFNESLFICSHPCVVFNSTKYKIELFACNVDIIHIDNNNKGLRIIVIPLYLTLKRLTQYMYVFYRQHWL